MPTRTLAWPSGTPCWVDAQVDDVAATAHFYSTLLGWELREEPPEIPGYLVGFRSGHKVAAIGRKAPGTGQPSVWSTYLATDDLDVSVQKLTGAGGRVLQPSRRIGENGRMSFVTDCAGAPFGIWESGLHTGVEVFNEPGTMCWNELHTHDYDASRWFYSEVFGWTYAELGDEPDFTYSYLHVPGTDAPVGGINLHPKPRGGTLVGNHWLPWFAVEELEQTTTRALSLGGGVIHRPDHSQHGHQAVLQGPEGEAFGVLETRGSNRHR